MTGGNPQKVTLPETTSNIAPENWWLGDYFLFGEGLFSGVFAVSFRECKPLLRFGTSVLRKGEALGHWHLSHSSCTQELSLLAGAGGTYIVFEVPE